RLGEVRRQMLSPGNIFGTQMIKDLGITEEQTKQAKAALFSGQRSAFTFAGAPMDTSTPAAIRKSNELFLDGLEKTEKRIIDALTPEQQATWSRLLGERLSLATKVEIKQAVQDLNHPPAANRRELPGKAQ